MRKVRELRGLRSLHALNAFSALMLGLKMLPEYRGLTYEQFLETVQKMDSADQERVIRQAVQFVHLGDDELAGVLSFVEDANGVPYSVENLKSLSAKDLIESIIAVCMKVAAVKIDLVTEAEKKN